MPTPKTLTSSQLKYHVQSRGSNFFNEKTMKAFGDRMTNYGVRTAIMKGEEVWELWRKKPVKEGHQDSAYFSKADYSQQFDW